MLLLISSELKWISFLSEIIRKRKVSLKKDEKASWKYS